MTVLLTLNYCGHQNSLEALKVEELYRRVETPVPDKLVTNKTWWGGSKVELVPQTPIVHEELIPDTLKVTTAETIHVMGQNPYHRVEYVSGVTYAQYAEALTKSSNGTVDLRPIQQAKLEKPKEPTVA